MSRSALLVHIRDTVAYLETVAGGLVESAAPDLDRLVDAYVETRQGLARDFRELAVFMVDDANARLDAVKSEITRGMVEKFGGAIPASDLVVKGYGETHAVLLAYICRRSGQPVPASRLRVLVGDQIHTERRVRDLRDLGFGIAWKSVAGENRYVLSSDQPDVEVAANAQVIRNLKADRRLSSARRGELLALVEPQT